MDRTKRSLLEPRRWCRKCERYQRICEDCYADVVDWVYDEVKDRDELGYQSLLKGAAE